MPEQSVVMVGCGRAAVMHTRTLRAIAPKMPLYYASRSGAKAAQFCQRYRGAGWFNSYEAAFEDERISTALITTPPPTHLELVLNALHSDKHVIVEKPGFLTSLEFDTVAIAAAAAERQVLVAENYYYKPIARELRSVIASGELGDLRLLLINALKWQRPAGWRADPEATGGGPLFEGGVHWISLLANLGLEISAIERIECGGPLTTVTKLTYTNGAVAVLAYSWEMRSRLRGLRLSRIYGTRGSVAFESNGLFLQVRTEQSRWSVPGLRDLAGYRAMFVDFLGALANGHEPRFTLDQARRDVALIRESERPQRERTWAI